MYFKACSFSILGDKIFIYLSILQYLKKLHLQERVVEEVKMAIKPFYSGKKINKDQYKDILRKAVPKVIHNTSSTCI
jgi:hypothetical protein